MSESSESFYITEAAPREADRARVAELCVKSQRLTGIPSPEIFSPDDLEGLVYGERVNVHLLAIHERTKQVIGHLAIEDPNPEHIEEWSAGVKRRRFGRTPPFIELGGLFIDPHFGFRGIGTALATKGLETIKATNAGYVIPVAATWAERPYARRIVEGLGGRELNTKDAVGGPITLWTFNKRRK